jgi:hypothetical protein
MQNVSAESIPVLGSTTLNADLRGDGSGLYSAKRSLFVCLFLARQPHSGRGLLIHEVSRTHTTTYYSMYDSSGLVISLLSRPLPDNIQHSQQTDIHAAVGFESTISTSEWAQTHALDYAAVGTSTQSSTLRKIQVINFRMI